MDLISKYEDFSTLNTDEQLEIKRKGRPIPDLNIVNKVSTSRGKSYARKFNTNIYEKCGWICGCEIKNRLFCFVCVLFGGETHWTISGVDDLVHLAEKAKLHGNSKQHLTNQMRLTLLGNRSIQEQLDTAYWSNIATYNEKVAKNRFILSKLIDAIKFCGIFELALRRGHDESENPDGIFQGPINYTAEIDKALKEHLEGSTLVFKGITSKEIQNDLLDCIFEVYREVVSTEIQNADFLGIMADETTDISSKLQTVIVFRYVNDGRPVERFWGFFTSEQHTAEVLSQLILKELEPLVAENPNKLIAQSYDGAAVMSGKQSGVQARIKEKYPVAHFVHCYAHQLNLIMTQAASQNNNNVALFFGNLSEIPAFFSNSSQQRVAFLDRILQRKIPSRSAPTRWNFKIRTVNVVFENKEELMECMEEIEETPGVNVTTKNQAGAIRRLLQEKSFIFWLTFFHYVMPHVDILFNELQKRIIDSVEINTSFKKFKESISDIRNKKIYDILNEAKAVQTNIETKRRKLNEDTWIASAIEVCDVIINVAEDRFTYTDQLNAANLFICEKFHWYDLSFPHDYFKKTIESYPMLEKNRMKTELTVLYTSMEYRNFSSCAVLLNFLIKNNLQEVFTETIRLLKILVTMPMTTAEAERNGSSLKRIKTFLRSTLGSTTMSQDQLNALACLSIEQKFIRSLPDLNEKVIEKFAMRIKDRPNCLPFILANDELEVRRIRCHATVLCCYCTSAATDYNYTESSELMTTQLLTPNKCDGGHYSCSPPKECCKQGCCFLLAPSYGRPPSVQAGNMFANPLFLGHWYFWLAVTATIAGILCACSLWRKHSQGGLCCRTGSGRNRTCSEPDSIGSCYAPPQYSSCNNFHAPPPPYSEVTSKPDMYPLVISYNNTEPVIKNNNNSSGYIIQYFRSFIRPIGSLSAASTNDSISSSFLCNAVNEANNVVPPTYSNIASLEQLVLDSPHHPSPSPSSSERRIPRSASSASSHTTEYHQVLQHSPSVNLQPKNQSSAPVAPIAAVHLRPPLDSNQNNKPLTSFSSGSNADHLRDAAREESKLLFKAPSSSMTSPPPIRERPLLFRPRRPLLQRSQDSTEDEELFSALLNLSICAPNSGEQAHPHTTTMLQDLGVTNSMTGSDISSLANLGTPDSPPRATSPTVEMRELLDKIQQLPAQKSPHPSSMSATAQGRAYFHRVRAKTMYMPLGEVQTVNSGKSLNKAIPCVFSKSWLSRSAPCTPCNPLAPPFPSAGRGSQKGSKTRITDVSPLLRQHAEETEDDHAPSRDVCL